MVGEWVVHACVRASAEGGGPRQKLPSTYALLPRECAMRLVWVHADLAAAVQSSVDFALPLNPPHVEGKCGIFLGLGCWPESHFFSSPFSALLSSSCLDRGSRGGRVQASSQTMAAMRHFITPLLHLLLLASTTNVSGGGAGGSACSSHPQPTSANLILRSSCTVQGMHCLDQQQKGGGGACVGGSRRAAASTRGQAGASPPHALATQQACSLVCTSGCTCGQPDLRGLRSGGTPLHAPIGGYVEVGRQPSSLYPSSPPWPRLWLGKAACTCACATSPSLDPINKGCSGLVVPTSTSQHAHKRASPCARATFVRIPMSWAHSTPVGTRTEWSMLRSVRPRLCVLCAKTLRGEQSPAGSVHPHQHSNHTCCTAPRLPPSSQT